LAPKIYMNRFSIVLLIATLSVGCEDAAVSSIRSQIVASTPLASPTTIEAAKESLDPSGEAGPVTFAGRVGFEDLDAFETGRAAFLVSELPQEDPNAGEGHDPSTCPFCKRRAARAPKAMVVLVDQTGREIKSRADRLLGLTVGDRITVHGTATFDPELNLLQVRGEQVDLGDG